MYLIVENKQKFKYNPFGTITLIDILSLKTYAYFNEKNTKLNSENHKYGKI